MVNPPRNHQLHDYDSACRMRDAIALHRSVLSNSEILAKRYCLIRLSDGSGTGDIFENRQQAFRHVPGLESLYAYPQIPLERWSESVCDALLFYVRQAYENGYRPDPDTPELALILPSRVDDYVDDITGASRQAW